MDRGMKPVDSVGSAKIQVDYLEHIDENHLNGEASARWSIEFCERYRSLEEGLDELYDDGELEDTEPTDVLSLVDETQYGEARELLMEEQER